MANVKILRKGIMPLRKLKVTINNDTFFLKGNESKLLTIPNGSHNLILRMDFWQSIYQININSEENYIIIKHYLPDFFYIIGIVFTIVFALLTFFSLISHILFTGFLLLFILPQLYLYLFRNKNYFFLNLNE